MNIAIKDSERSVISMIKIMTDSSVCVKKWEAEELSLNVIPLGYVVGDQRYFESYTDHNGNFERRLKSGARCTTSSPSIGAFLSAFSEELSRGNEVLCITMSSRLSGTYSAAYMAAKQTESPHIVVFDSLLIGGGLYLLIRAAKKLVEMGVELSDIVKQLIKIRDRITIAFSVDDMKPLRNSGRIGFVRMNVRTILNIKPILLCQEGVVVSDCIARGNVEVIKKFMDKISTAAKEVVVNYIENSSVASNLYNVMKEKYPDLPVKLQRMGPVLGIHLGLQAVAVSFLV